ncbi:MAG TPA: hypothetical protein PLE99_08425 [Candidatus Thiothrix moscowensis]|uniref:PA3496 family putative envelope integrity protein n=1 Tax=unclassified Thiothrix TaxID=2636184 RepID=UPI001A323AFB|nr:MULTISPECIES: hypothetical protein [unclassified Thiothrix]MBJ6610339.1 hypothetical protein [Candidatus Thiothrix moscowensis]HRJ52780.1 hypothetical protein [Candidatus Thiothrix moscowensis]HRJ94451.1 hypothetical protein [Candidatus Thiothrix moscowensis]
MRNNKAYDTEQEDDLFNLEKLPAASDGKKVKPHVVRRNVEDYLEKKALERRLKDVFEENF